LLGLALGPSPATQPTTQPAMQPTTAPAAAAVAEGPATQPATRPAAVAAGPTTAPAVANAAVANVAEMVARAHKPLPLITLDRQSPVEFDLSRGFEADAALTGVQFRAAPDGPVLAGLEEVRAEAVHVRPATGDVRAKSLEIVKPTLHAERDAKGIYALGLLL